MLRKRTFRVLNLAALGQPCRAAIWGPLLSRLTHTGSIYLKDSFRSGGWDMHGCPSILRGSGRGGRNRVGLFMLPPAENLSRYQTDRLHLFLMCCIRFWVRLPPGCSLSHNISYPHHVKVCMYVNPCSAFRSAVY
jgi:hypothetical protein